MDTESSKLSNNPNENIYKGTLEKPSQIPIVCPGHARPLAELDYSLETPDGDFLLSACHDKLPMLRNGTTGDWIGTFEGHKGAVWSAKMNTDATLVATGSGDFSVKLWDSTNGDDLLTLPHKHVVKTVCFSNNNNSSNHVRLATGGKESMLRIYDINDQSSELATPLNSISTEADISKIVFYPNSEHILYTGLSNGSIHCWDLRSGTTSVSSIKLSTGPSINSIMDMEMSRDGTVLSVAHDSMATFLTLAPTPTLEILLQHELPMRFNDEGGLSLHPSHSHFVAGGHDLTVRIFEFETGKEVNCLRGHHGPVRCIRHNYKGTKFASGSEDGTIRIWQHDHE